MGFSFDTPAHELFRKVSSGPRSEKVARPCYRPTQKHVEYASAVWSPHEVKPIHQLEIVQRRTARWTLNRHHNTSSVKGMLEDLQWRTLEQRRTDCRLVLLFQIIHGLVQIPPTNYLQPSLNTTSRKNHNYTYQQCSTRTNYFKYSFFPYTTVIWNNLPYQLVNSPSVISFKAQVSISAHQGVAWCSLVFNVLTLSYFFYTFLYFHPFTILYICKYVPTNACAQQHLGSTQVLVTRLKRKKARATVIDTEINLLSLENQVLKVPEFVVKRSKLEPLYIHIN